MNAATTLRITAPLEATRSQRTRALLFTGTALTGLFVLRLFNPVGAGFYPQCPLHLVTGLYCPGCGSTRALYQLLHGHPAAAFAMNPLLVIMLPVLVYAFLSYALVGLRGRGLPRFFIAPKLIKLFFWALVLYGVLRNLPFSPFNLLAPHTL